MRIPIWAGAALVTVLVFEFIINGYIEGRWAWEGSGFSGASLWDWLDLLIVPLILGVGGVWFQRAQRQREQEADQRRHQRELETEDQRAQSVALQAYLEQMARLLFEEGLHEEKGRTISDIIMDWPKSLAKASVARAYTLTTLE